MNRRLVTAPSKLLPLSIADRYLELQLLRILVRQAEKEFAMSDVDEHRAMLN
jgi:hypothetical protein